MRNTVPLTYDSDSGALSRSGVQVGTRAATGYTVVWHCGRLWLAHRLAWLLMTGEEPEQVDHINGNRSDNRWVNLRSATNTQNQEARHTVVACSGKMGVYYRRDTGKWQAKIKSAGKSITLGCFATIEEASAAYQAAKLITHSRAPGRA